MVFRLCLVAEKVLGRKLRFDISEWLAREFRVSSSLFFFNAFFVLKSESITVCVCVRVYEGMEWRGNDELTG